MGGWLAPPAAVDGRSSTVPTPAPSLCCSYEWVATPKMDWNNPAHRKLKAEIEIGNGLPDITYAGAVVDALVDAGFEVQECRDLAPESPVPWHRE